jgi:hypothetical protein
MKSENPFWCVAIVKELPESFKDGILLSEGFSAESPENIPSDEISFALLFRTLSSSEALACSVIRESINSLGIKDGNQTEIIVLKPKCILRSEKRIFSGMSDGDVSMRNLSIGFKNGNAEALNAALNIVRSAIEKRPWEFWK